MLTFARYALVSFVVLFLAPLSNNMAFAHGDGEPHEKSPSAYEVIPAPADAAPALKDPTLATKQAPDIFDVRFETTKGDFTIEVHRAWSPLGADRFYNLVTSGYYDDAAFFRVIENFMVQFGLSPYPEVNAAWKTARIPDDPMVQSNTRGYVTFAMAGPNTRTTQVFINFGNNARLDPQNFSPFGKVTVGMDIVDSLYSGYGEGAPRGKGPSQGLLAQYGKSYLGADFPELDTIKTATITGSRKAEAPKAPEAEAPAQEEGASDDKGCGCVTIPSSPVTWMVFSLLLVGIISTRRVRS
jgi:peptidyl-prolyl cis-trans isomerase A (cyclophilin A)